MRCARTISAATAPGTSTRRRSTRARCGRSPLLACDQCRAVDGSVDDVDRHRHVRAPPRLPPLGRRRSIRRSRRGSARSPRTGMTSGASSSTRTTSSRTRANVLGTSETLDGAFDWLRAKAGAPSFLYVHNWATHMPYDIVHADRKNWLAAKTEVIAGIQSDSASALESMREGLGGRRAAIGGPRRLVPRGARVARPAGEHGLCIPLRPRRVVGRTVRHQRRREGRLPHARRDALRRDRRGAADPLGGWGLAPGVVDSQVRSIDLMPTLLELAGLPARETDGESASPHVDGDRPAIIAGTDMGALTKLAVRKPPWKLILDVDSGEEEAYQLDLDPRELRRRPHGRAAGDARHRLPRARERGAARADGGGRGHRREASLRPRVPVTR